MLKEKYVVIVWSGDGGGGGRSLFDSGSPLLKETDHLRIIEAARSFENKGNLLKTNQLILIQSYRTDIVLIFFSVRINRVLSILTSRNKFEIKSFAKM